jgi:catechol 2,3-dioxygenase-like lactoylglutathione lyase family enzyme
LKLNHLSFPSSDVEATAAFFERYLECKVAPAGSGRFLSRPDFDIVIEHAEGRVDEWPRNFHIGIELPAVDDVQAMYERFVAEGIRMETQLLKHPRGSRFFCWIPGGFLLEVNTRADVAERYRPMFAGGQTLSADSSQ